MATQLKEEGLSAIAWEDIWSSYLHKESERSIIAKRFQHRINLCQVWGIEPGWQILDIGCGQGESSLVLASFTGPSGLVTGIDTAPPGYGGPYTLVEAQAFIAASPLGSRIRFHSIDAPKLLASTTPPPPRFDCAILCHSLWYFADEATISNLFGHLARARVGRVCLAEYTGRADTPDQLAHALAAEAQMLLVKSRTPRERIQDWNVRVSLFPADFIRIATSQGWKVQRSGTMKAPDGLIDGHREARMVQSEVFRKNVKAECLDPQVEAELLSLSDRVRGACDELAERGAQVRCMDTFWAVLTLDG
ncbi:hypothetical protein VTK26DRAFT_5926 [Humicola hyalothermophila]